MEKERKIKDIYGCEDIVSTEELYPLQKWYNQLLNKNFNEITIPDILRMLRQNEFIDISIARAILFLKKDVFSGELYEGEVIEKLFEININYLTDYIDDLKEILLKSLNAYKNHEWLCAEEENEFKNIVYKFLQKITNIHIS